MKIHRTFTILALVTALGAAAPAVRAAPPKGTQQQLRDLEEEIDKLKSVVVQLDRLLGSLSGELSAALGRIEELEMEPLPPEPVLGFASANGLVSTALSSWSTIPDMTVTLDVAGTARVRFCAETGTSGQGSGRVKARVDGQDVLPGSSFPPGASLQFSLNGPRELSCFQWVVDGLEDGSHVFDVQYRTFGDATAVDSRVLTVEGTVSGAP